MELSNGAYDWLMVRYQYDVGVLDKELVDQDFILGDKISAADFSLSAYLMYANEAEIDVPSNVVSWLNRLKSQNSWENPYQMLG